MQKIKIDFDNPGLPQHISAVENDSQSRFFQAMLYENGKAYTAPEGATYSIMYRGFGPQNQGWYDTINDSARKRAACAVSGNVVTCEIARQALQVPGHVSIVLCVTTGKGYMLKSWPIECDCKNDRYDSTAEVQSFFYITRVSNADWTQAIQAWENLKNTIDPTLSVEGKAADAAKVGEAVGQVKDDLENFFVSRLNFEYEVGGIDESTGVINTNTKYIRTKDFIVLGSAVHIKKPSKSAIAFYQYNEKYELEKKHYFGESITSANQEAVPNKKYKIVYNHTPVEEANLEVYKIEFKLFPETSKIVSLSNAPFIFPELFHSDTDADWTEAINLAIKTGKDVICSETYNISNIVIDNPVNLIGGKFTSNGSNYAITVNSNNVNIKNISLDCTNSCNGILISSSANVTIDNSEIFNCKHTQDTNGIRATRCKDVYIYNTHIHHIGNDNSKPTRAIQFNKTKHSVIKYCTINDVDSGDDADGIHVLYDGSTDESNDKTTIENCDIYNCRKRCIKIQQQNTTIKNCTFLYEKSTIGCAVSTISVYDSNCTIEGCYLNGNSPVQIALLGDSSDTGVIRNTKIINNTLCFSAQTYQGLVQTVENSKLNFSDLYIVNNDFIGSDTLNDHGICFRNVKIGYNIIVANNNFSSLNHAVYFRNDDRNTEINKFICCNNIMDTNYSCILIESDAIKVIGINITGNLFSAKNRYKDEYRLLGYSNISCIKPALTTVANNTPTTGTTKQLEWLNTSGNANTSLPLVAKNMWVFFDTNTNKTLTYYDGKWYYPNGALVN